MAVIENVASSSTVPPPKVRHDVFLSFRGIDTRNNFTSHLHSALCRNSVDAYIDERLETGHEISPALREAIQGSEISLVIFSENYASSWWCLDELVHILECRRRFGQAVVPVFYNVDPSMVRKQENSYKRALDELEKRFHDRMEKVKAWRVALTEAANLSGFHSQANRPDSKLINEIVDVVLKKLNQNLSDEDFKDLVGMREHVDKVQSLMNIDPLSTDVLVIGLWGIGGIGKTTLASLVYNRIRSEFDSCFFLANAREVLQKHGLMKIRDKILAELLQDKGLKLETPILQSHYVKRRLRRKKVLLVLDDMVNDLCEFECFYDKDMWFGPGSRIIVTTRDSKVLKNIKGHKMYEIEELNYQNAAKLFRLKAFEDDFKLGDEFCDLSKQVVEYCKGIPLALSVIGSDLRGRGKPAWESAIKQLAEDQDETVHKVLKVSYDSLTDIEKMLFLDLACFFKGEERYLIETYYNFSRTISIDKLVEKSLITIPTSKNIINMKIAPRNKIWMHDLIQEMGQELARKSAIESGEHIRLWKKEDVVHVLGKKTGTTSVEGIFLDMSEMEDQLNLSPKSFSKMHNLKCLKIYDSDKLKKKSKVLLPKGLDSLPNSLTYLHWLGFPCKSLPQKFNPRNLVELSMPFSQVDRLWDGVLQLGSLKRIDLRFSKITRVPDLSEAAKLERLDLYFCEKLTQIPSYFQQLKQLSYLNLSFCSSITAFPELSSNIKSLYISFTSINQVPSCIGDLTNLESFWLAGLQEIKNLPPSISKLDSLRFLNLCYTGLEEFPDITQPMNSLDALSLEGTKIKSLPSSIHNLVKLTYLNLNSCINLENLPDRIDELEYLKHVSILECSKLKNLPHFKNSLAFVDARGCTSLDTKQRFIFNDPLLKRKMVYDTKIGIKHWENFADQTEVGSSFMKHCPRTEVPRCFYDSRIKDSCLINIELPPVEGRSSKTDIPYYFCFSPCVVVEFGNETADKVLNFCCRSRFRTSIGETHEFECLLRGLGGEEFDEIKMVEAESCTHVFLWHDYGLYVDDSEDYMFTEASFEFCPVDGSKKSADHCCKVIESGLRVRYVNSRDSHFTDPEPLTLTPENENKNYTRVYLISFSILLLLLLAAFVLFLLFAH